MKNNNKVFVPLLFFTVYKLCYCVMHIHFITPFFMSANCCHIDMFSTSPVILFMFSEKHVPEWNVVTAKIHKGITGDVENMSMWQQLADMKKGVMKWAPFYWLGWYVLFCRESSFVSNHTLIYTLVLLRLVDCQASIGNRIKKRSDLKQLILWICTPKNPIKILIWSLSSLFYRYPYPYGNCTSSRLQLQIFVE
jgi:hypothetical protein